MLKIVVISPNPVPVLDGGTTSPAMVNTAGGTIDIPMPRRIDQMMIMVRSGVMTSMMAAEEMAHPISGRDHLRPYR